MVAGTVAATSILLFPSTLAAFWNIGERLPLQVAIGTEERAIYESRYLSASDLSVAINRLSEPGSFTVGSAAYVRSKLEDGRDASPDWEFGGRLALNYPTPPAGVDEIYDRWRALGADMIAVDAGARVADGYSSDTMSLLAERAELVWADRGLELYQLTFDPSQARALTGCSTRFTQGNECWGVQLDGSPGLSPAEAVNGARQTRPVCPDATYQINATSDGTTGGARLEIVARDQTGALDEGSHQDHVGADITQCFRLTGDAFHRFATDVTDADTNTNYCQTGANCCVHNALIMNVNDELSVRVGLERFS